jgi:hypothetical protein
MRGAQLRVKFIRAVDLGGLEKAINEWLPAEGAEQTIVDRTFAMTDAYWVAALWYTKGASAGAQGSATGAPERHLSPVRRDS